MPSPRLCLQDPPPERTEELRKLQKGGNILPMLGLKLIEHDEEEVDGEDGEGDAEEGEL